MYLFLCYPACSTCKEAETVLKQEGVLFEKRDIKMEHPTAAELREWIGRSGLPVKKFFNTSGLVYKELQLKDKLPGMSEEEMIDILATNGMLVKRPLLIGQNKVLVGFRQDQYRNL